MAQPPAAWQLAGEGPCGASKSALAAATIQTLVSGVGMQPQICQL